MQVELNYSIVSCTIFCLRPFMMAVSTNYGTAGNVSIAGSKNNSRNYPYGAASGKPRSRAAGESFTLRSITKSFGKEITLSSTSDKVHSEVNLNAGSGAGVRTLISSAPQRAASRRSKYHPGHDGRSSTGSDGSTKLIILKDIEYTVQHHQLGKINSEELGTKGYSAAARRYE
jgi:hypothetical protein